MYQILRSTVIFLGGAALAYAAIILGEPVSGYCLRMASLFIGLLGIFIGLGAIGSRRDINAFKSSMPMIRPKAQVEWAVNTALYTFFTRMVIAGFLLTAGWLWCGLAWAVSGLAYWGFASLLRVVGWNTQS